MTLLLARCAAHVADGSASRSLKPADSLEHDQVGVIPRLALDAVESLNPRGELEWIFLISPRLVCRAVNPGVFFGMGVPKAEVWA